MVGELQPKAFEGNGPVTREKCFSYGQEKENSQYGNQGKRQIYGIEDFLETPGDAVHIAACISQPGQAKEWNQHHQAETLKQR